ncbi:RHS repeat-associated core domain-containing protein, partial [Flavobacterium psychrophilum]|uniref:RHS repeat-associated core domain-containing protein n=1 Tax=Flavobacterium psychrophilum TaxID=96345 RepID=UPI003393EBA6
QNANENQEPPQGWPRQPVFNAPNDVPGPPVQFGPPITPTDVKAGEGFVGNGLPEKDVFYYHPDHLGSSSYISTLNGQISQHVEYIAFGEVLFEEHSSSFKSPYLFNGKELDRETNLSYYGARYLDMKTSLWLSVDPLAEEFPDWNPYNYCMQNPINMIDPTGMEGEKAIDPPVNNKPIVLDEVVIRGKKKASTTGDKIINRTLGGLQMIGGTAEAIVGGVGGILTAETGVGAAVGWAILTNGIDNATTGAQQLWTGEDEETLLHQGVEKGSLGLGADEDTAENIATGADIATIALGGGGSTFKSSKNLKPMIKNTKGLKQIGLRAINTNKQFRIERHGLQGTGRRLTRTHINYGVGGKKHKFFRNAKELRKYVKE